MNDEALQNLIRAAHQCELPSADAVERFIDEFHRRQLKVSMKQSLLEKVESEIASFFSHFRLPALAYASATAIAVFVSIMILRSPRLNEHQMFHPLFSEQNPPLLNYVSSPALQERIEPVSFDLKKKNEETGDVVSPLSFILKTKSSPSAKNF